MKGIDTQKKRVSERNRKSRRRALHFRHFPSASHIRLSHPCSVVIRQAFRLLRYHCRTNKYVESVGEGERISSSHTWHSVCSLLFRSSHPCSLATGAVLIALASRRSSPFLCSHRCVLRADSCLITENHHQIHECNKSELSWQRSILFCRHFGSLQAPADLQIKAEDQFWYRQIFVSVSML